MSFYFGCYWYKRGESIEDVAAKIVDFLKLLKNNDQSRLFGNWYQLGYSKKEALSKPIELEYSNVLNAVIKDNKLTRKIKGSPFYNEDGFLFSAWNGLDDDESCSVSITAGSSLSVIPNCCVLQIDSFSEKLDFEYISKLVSLLTHHWNPFWTIFSSSIVSDKLNCASEIGLINYFNEKFVFPRFDGVNYHQEEYGAGKVICVIDKKFKGDVNDNIIEELKQLYQGMKKIESNWNASVSI